MNSKQGKILVVDDEELLGDVWTDIFKMLGHEILVANSVSAAIKLIQSHRIRLLLTDLRMPNADGIALLDYVAQEIDYPIPTFVCSGYLEPDRGKLERFTIHRIIPKPFNVKEELEYFREFLAAGDTDNLAT